MKVPLSITGVVLALVLFVHAPHQAQTARPLRDRPDPSGLINAFSFSPDGRILALACGAGSSGRVELWDTLSGKLRRTISGFDGTVFSVSFSPDGRTLVTGSSGMHPYDIRQRSRRLTDLFFSELKWWDAQTGEFRRRFELKDHEVWNVAAQYSPDGKFLAAQEHRLLYDNSHIRLLDADTGNTLLKLKDGFSDMREQFSRLWWPPAVSMMGYSKLRRAISFSPNGQYVAAWNSNEVRLWLTATGEEVIKLTDFEKGLGAIAFSGDGSLLATALTKTTAKGDHVTFQSEIRIWEIPTGNAVRVIPLNLASVTGLVFTANGQYLLTSGLQPQANHIYAGLEIADVKAGSAAFLMAREEGSKSAVEMSPAGDLLVLQTDSSIAKLIELPGWKVRFTLDASAGVSMQSNAWLRPHIVTIKTVSAVAFLPDGKTVVGEVEAGGVKLWDWRTGEVKKIFGADAETGSIAELSKNGDVLAEINSDENVRVWDVASAKNVEISSAKRGVTAIAISSNGKALGIAYPNQMDIFDINDPAQPKKTTIIQGQYAGLALSLDGKFVAGVNAAGNLSVWNSVDGRQQATFVVGAGVSCMRFLPNGEALAIGMKDGRVSLWNLPLNAKMFESKKHSATVTAIAFSNEGTLMATGSDDRTAIVWDLPGGNARHTLRGHDFTVSSIAFSADSSTLAVAGGNASVALWEVASGKLNRVLR
jgi:WD40 repeat protein